MKHLAQFRFKPFICTRVRALAVKYYLKIDRKRLIVAGKVHYISRHSDFLLLNKIGI